MTGRARTRKMRGYRIRIKEVSRGRAVADKRYSRGFQGPERRHTDKSAYPEGPLNEERRDQGPCSRAPDERGDRFLGEPAVCIE
ncbi:hypothetical protein X946_5523 [Burkholderia sp. ABCPW 111]|nr:hypothetical protein X946_5523 [Burkholderia sp. ABCPW 111]